MPIIILSLRRLAVLAAALVLAGCSTTGALTALEPAKGGTAVRDIVYGDQPRQRLDVYAPRAQDAPVVVFFYGGSWDSGAKRDYAFVGKVLAARGYVAVVPDYRIYPQATWPVFLQDNAKAVAWARAHAAEYGGDPRKLVLMGHSAGAYNAVMLALDRRWLGEVGLDPRRDIAGVVGLAGVYDFLPLSSERLKTIFGPEAARPDTQPINHVDGQAPPLLLAHDLADTVVEVGNTSRLAAAVSAKGGQVETRYYSGVNHALILGALAAPLRFLAPVMDDASRFIDRVTRDDTDGGQRTGSNSGT